MRLPIWYLLGWGGKKQIQATPIKQDLGTSKGFFKMSNERPCPLYIGVPPSCVCTYPTKKTRLKWFNLFIFLFQLVLLRRPYLTLLKV